MKDSVGLAKESTLTGIGENIRSLPFLAGIIPAYLVSADSASLNARASGGGTTTNAFSLTGGYWYGSADGDYIEFDFYGKFVNVIFAEKTTTGVVDYSIDGVITGTISISELSGPNKNLYWIGPSNLEDKWHTIRLTYRGGYVRIAGIHVDPTKNPYIIYPFPYPTQFNIAEIRDKASSLDGKITKCDTDNVTVTTGQVEVTKMPPVSVSVETVAITGLHGVFAQYNNESVASGSTNTYGTFTIDWADRKTVGVWVNTGDVSVKILVSNDGTNFYDYYSKNVTSGSSATMSFTESFASMRVEVLGSTDAGYNLLVSRQV